MDGIILDKSASLGWTVAKSRLNALMETLSEEEKARFQKLFDDDSIIILDKKDYPIIDPFSEPPPLAKTFDEVRTWDPKKRLSMKRKVSASIDTGRAQQVEYIGPQGRAKVTFGTGEAIVSRLKPNGSWKVVARHPWPEKNECRVNATLQGICGAEFHAKED